MVQEDSWLIGKRFLVIFSIAAGLLSGIAMTHYYVSMETERIKRENSELLNLELGKSAIVSDLENVTSDLMFLVEHESLQGLFESNDRVLLSMLAAEFLVFAKRKGTYDQIRYLDETGQEVVRVNYNNANPTIVSDNQLQNKADRYYFKKTWNLEPEEVYISPFDLNVEHGQIEQPPKPMIRFGTPVFDRSGEKKGIVLLNYLGEKLIRDFKRAAANIADHIMLINADGYWLSNPLRNNEWGFMYNNDQTFQEECPEAWRRIKTQNSGQFRNEDGLFSFTSISPLSYAIGNRWSSGTSVSPVIDEGNKWKVVSRVSPKLLMSARHEFFNQQLPFYLAMLSVLAIASLLLARALVKHKQAATQIESERRARGGLEEQIEERTRELEDSQTEKDRVVQQLIQAEKMAAIGAMASGIGHEINNPLYVILTMGEALRDDADTSHRRHYGQKIIKHAERIAEIVKNLSGYVLPAQQHDLEMVDMNQKLSEAISMARQSYCMPSAPMEQI